MEQKTLPQSIRDQVQNFCTYAGKCILVSFSYSGTAPYVACFRQYSDLCKFMDEHPDMTFNIIGADCYE